MAANFMIYFCLFSLPQWILAYIIYKIVCNDFRHVTFRNDGGNDIYLHLNGAAKLVAAGNKIDFLCRKKPLKVQITSDGGEYDYPPLDIENEYEPAGWGAPKVLIALSNDLRLLAGSDDARMEVPGQPILREPNGAGPSGEKSQSLEPQAKLKSGNHGIKARGL